MTTSLVKDFLAKKGKKGDIGIEIEVESETPLPHVKTDLWKCKGENSLRVGGMEYISNGPLVISEVPGAIESLNKALVKNKIIHTSPRASVHMHCNVLYSTPVQYWNQVASYWLVEPLLFDFLGHYRRGNCFCLSLDSAEGVVDYCLKDLKADMPFHYLGNDNIRYASQNLKATAQFGSIEYRSMAFTLEPKKLNTWASELYNLRLNSKDYRSPAALMDSYFSSNSSKDFLSTLFSKKFVSEIAVGDWKDKLETNEGLLCELSYAHDWDKWTVKIEKNLKERGAKVSAADEANFAAERAPRARGAQFNVGLVGGNVNVVLDDMWAVPPPRQPENDGG